MTTPTRPADAGEPSRDHTAFVGSIPEHYDRCLGPFLFEFYARDLARRLRVPDGGRVLEIACGTGISTRHLRTALVDSVEIVATDLNEAMLDHARRACHELASVRFEQADALALPFEDAAFDAVVCQFGVMFFPDRVQGMREIRRVLHPGGAFVWNSWGSMRANPIMEIVNDTLTGYFGGEPPTFFDVPFGYHDDGVIVEELRAAGFGDCELERVRTTGESASARELATGFVEGTPGIAEIRERATAPPAEIAAALAHEFVETYGDAPLRAPLEAISIVARCPAV